MAKQPSTPSPERAAQDEAKRIPIEDARSGTEVAQSRVPDTDPGDGSEPPTPSPEAVADTDAPEAGPAGPAEGGASIGAEEKPCEGEPAPSDEGPTADEMVAQAQAEAKEWQDKFVRLHAEWDTYRRRTAEQREAEKARAAEKLVTSLLPVIDDFERTIEYAASNGEAGLLDGVKAVRSKLVNTLTSGGVEVIDPKGGAFDALEAQAVATVEDANVPDETVAEVYQKGYKMGSKVLRPAMVSVTTGGPKREKKPDQEQEK
ncbi:nucleotide exchange factor GrpE [Gordonibacter sp. An230]|uniref:nucleotide exchange factor GrpE n=1 Tax=Gordonibacter sp. An230 TaxID=1965592 RepID=UPI000B39AA58|nr:nucleotide exchange factor GrpE [Gordonibacter sp. An230]OUO90585.1 nucleotide exchange factor GrpE [Gordonibacter sp. An230]